MADLDALELLRSVSKAYRAIATLEVEAVIVRESGDEEANSRSEHRLRFYYSAPNRIRCDTGRNNGKLQVSDGSYLHMLFQASPAFRGRPRMVSVPIGEVDSLPHAFRPDLPFTTDATFFFHRIDEGAAAARVVREDDGRRLVAVTYSKPSPHPAMFVRGDALFWIDPDSLMVMKQQIEIGHRIPTEDEVRWDRITTSVRKIRLNQPIPDEIFQFTPPADAATIPEGRVGISMGSGTGFGQGSNQNKRMEHRALHEYEGDSLIEDSTWKLRDHVLTFQRSMTMSEDESEVIVDEKIKSAQGEAEHRFHLRLK